MNLYTYAVNNPAMFSDPEGLHVYRGICRYISGGELVGAGQIRCKVWAECSDGSIIEGHVVAMFGGLTAGLPAGVTYFNITLNSPGFRGEPSFAELKGFSFIASASGAAGLGGSATYLKLGKAGGEVSGPQFGIDRSVDAFIGYSWLDDGNSWTTPWIR